MTLQAGGLRVADPGAIRHSLMLQINQRLVLNHVRTQGNTTRPEIATSLDLSAATVSRIVRRLVEQGLVREQPGVSRGGRPRTSISFNTLSGCVVGVDLGGTKCHGILTDLAGDVLVEEVQANDNGGGPFATLVEMIEHLRRREERGRVPLVALAVGVPAIVDPVSGVAIGGPNVHWDGFPIVSALAEQVDVPFLVDNDVNLAALGHAWRGDARGRSDFVVLSLGTGIGAAIVADGRLLKGRNSAAGEIGYMVLDRDQLRAPRPDGLGAFETLASGPAMAEVARRRLADGRRGSGRQATEGPLGPEAIFAAAASGDGVAIDVIGDVADHVAMAIIALASVVNPEVVVLDGSVGLALGSAVPGIQDLVDRDLPAPPKVVVSSLGGEATALGAVAAALDLSRTKQALRHSSRGGGESANATDSPRSAVPPVMRRAAS
ncbi:MAG: ROK family transcriptional regulator [Chloroflexota bacterium]